jgi:hypothetical protein
MKNFILRIRHLFLSAAPFLLMCMSKTHSQSLLYNEQFTGGVTGGGYSPVYYSGGEGTFDVYIEPGSTIQKAYLLAGRHGLAANLTVTLNNDDLEFNNSNQVSGTFQSPLYGGNSAVHAIDVTTLLDPSVTFYTLEVPFQPGPSNRYNDFYLFIAYHHASLPEMNVALFINENDLADAVTWSLNLPFAWNTNFDAALALFTGYSCFNGDGESVTVDGSYLGDYYGPESNSGECGGPLAQFYYQAGTLTSMGDDDKNQEIDGPDVLSNVSGVVANGGTESTIFFDSQTGISDNAIWAVVTVNGGGCGAVSEQTDTTSICYGGSVQLSVEGGASYAWSPATGLSDSTAANPIASPDTATLYTVTVTDSFGCESFYSFQINVTSFGTAGPDVTICQGDTVQISASGSLSYSWTPATGLSNPFTSDPLCFAASTTTYVINFVNPNDCINQDTLVVTVIIPPAPVITQNGNLLTCSAAPGYQWKLDGVNIPGATNQTYLILIGGFYSCSVITNDGCETESDLLLANPVGINEAGVEEWWSVFPNPASQEISISTEGMKGEPSMRIINALGQEVMAAVLLNEGVNTISIMHLSPGVYFCELKSDEAIEVRKWVKRN